MEDMIYDVCIFEWLDLQTGELFFWEVSLN